MCLREVKSQQRSKDYKSYFIQESYRNKKGLRAQTIYNVAALSEEIQELMRLDLHRKRISEIEDLRLEEQSNFRDLAVLRETWDWWGLEDVLASVKDPNKTKHLQALIFGRILFLCSKLFLKEEAWGTLLEQACSLEKSEGFEEEGFYREWMGSAGVWSRIEHELFRRASHGRVRLVLYDLSSTYFDGEDPNRLARYGYSRDYQEEQPTVILSMATDAEGIAVHVEVHRDNRSDSTTIPKLLVTLWRRLGIAKAVFVFDCGTRSLLSLEVLMGMERGSVARATWAQFQELMDKLSLDRQPELWDRTKRMDVEKDGLWYIIAEREWLAKRYLERQEARIGKTKLLLEEFKRNARKGEDAFCLDSRVGRMLERCKAHKYIRYGIDRKVRFWWKLHEEESAKEEATDDRYLLETNLLPTEYSAKKVLAHYKNLCEANQAFCRRFPAYWMTARLVAEWSKRGVFKHVPRLLRRLQTIRPSLLSVKGKPAACLLIKISRKLNRLLEKTASLPAFLPAAGLGNPGDSS
ncbi:IS1634 family transposase [Candidatus Methylacidiphilum fumarolicum]|nr:hypothetical protein [Candidatus Methylacidiphilum fumarolicum]